MKVVAFSIYGKDNKYIEGLYKNIELCSIFYNDWKIYIYYDDSVDPNVIVKCLNNKAVKTFNMTGKKTPGMFWRFQPNDDVELFIVRDSDSRITYREKLAVEEWIDSKKTLHIMRDHPHHRYYILGGMWGFRNREDFNMVDEIYKYLNNRNYNLFTKMLDMAFLRDVIYKIFSIDSIIHASVHKYEQHAKSFPIKMEDFRFVGEIINADESRERQYKEWINLNEL